MKTLKDFTPEIKAKIPEYQERALRGVFDGGRYKAFYFESAFKAVCLQYEKTGYKKPLMLVAENPYEAQVMLHYIKNHPFWKLVIGSLSQLDSQLRSQLRRQLDNQLDSQLRSQLRRQLDNQLDSQLRSQLDNQLYSQLYSQLRSQLRRQLDNQLDNQLDSQLDSQLQLYSQLDSQLHNQLGSQLHNQLYSQLDSQLRSQLRRQLRRQLDNQLDSQLRSQLRSQLYSQLYSQLRSQLRRQLDNQLDNQLDSQLDSQLHNQLGSQLHNQLYSQLGSQLDSQLYNQLHSQLHSQLYSQLDSQLRSQLRRHLRRQLGSQKIKYQDDYLFTLNVYSSAYFAWYSFISKEFGIDAAINSELEIFSTAYENSNIYSALFTEAVCVVSKFPKRIYRNSENNLHNPSGVAVEWGSLTELTKWDCYYINGRNLPAWIWDKAAKNEFTKEDFLKETNSEIKGGIYEVLGQRRIMELLGAIEIDKRTIVHKNGDLEEVTLLKTKERFEEIDNEPFAWVRMNCPSTGTNYLQGVEPHHKNALEAIASLSMFDAKDYAFDLRS